MGRSRKTGASNSVQPSRVCRRRCNPHVSPPPALSGIVASTSLLLAAILASLPLLGCIPNSNVTVTSIAVSKSNQEAKRLFHVEPFREGHGQWRPEGVHKVWDALTSTAKHDFTAKVVLDESGAVVSVTVRKLEERISAPAPNLGPNGQERPLGIPEVMAK
jgi:hypothetical protein